MKLLPRKPITADSNVARGTEFALGTALFLLIGYVLDRWLDTRPVFTICFFFLGVIGQFAAMWYRYAAEMAVHDAERGAATHAHHAGPQTSANATGKGTA